MNDYNDKVTKIDEKLKVLNSKISELEYERICILMVKRDIMMKNTKDILTDSFEMTMKQHPEYLDGDGNWVQ